MLTIILAGVLFLLYMLFLLLPGSYRFSSRVLKWLRIVQCILLAVILSIVVLANKKIYLSGYWTPKIIFWLWFFLSFCLYAFSEKKRLYYPERLFYKIFFVLPLLFLPLLLIPFIGVGIALLVYATTIGDPSMIVYSSEKIRVEKSGISLFGPPLPLDVYEKKGFLSYKRTSLSHQFEMYDTLIVKESADGRILIQAVYPGDQKTDTVNYELRSASQ